MAHANHNTQPALVQETTYKYDIYLSYSHKDREVARNLANRLKSDGLRVLLEELRARHGHSILPSIETGLHKSQVTLLILSHNILDSEWFDFESSTVIFHAPTNIQERFIPLLLDDCTIPDTLRGFSFIDYRGENQAGYQKLIDFLEPTRVARSTTETSPALLHHHFLEQNRLFTDTIWNGFSLHVLQQHAPELVTLLKQLAFLDPDKVPFKLLKDEEMDDATFDQAIQTLDNFSWDDFSRITITSNSISIHHTFQDLIRKDLQQHGKDKEQLATLLKKLNRLFLFDYNDAETWELFTPYVPHVQAVVAHAEPLKIEPEITIELLDQVGRYFQRSADFQHALSLLQRALQWAETHYGHDTPQVAIRANNLGLVFQDIGKLPEAKTLYEQALIIGERTYGQNHPHVATMANNLGAVLKELGQLPEAKTLYAQALIIDEKNYGKDHPMVANRANNLGVCRT